MQSIDLDTLQWGELKLTAQVLMPGFMVFNRDFSRFYSIQHDGNRKGFVNAFAVDPETGELTLLNEQPAAGMSLCHVCLDQSEKYLIAVSYGDAMVSLFPLNEDGSIQPLSDSAQHTGTGVHPTRQTKAHAHSAYVDPTNQYFLVSDLGLDKIFIYKLDHEKASFAPGPMPFVRSAPGAGPRHLAFHPNGKWVYSINELDGTVAYYQWNADAGTLIERQIVDTLPEDYDKKADNTTAEILVSQDGRFVYGSNRGHDSIVVYSVDSETGELELIQREPSQGEHPRNFRIDPTGRWLVVANRDTDNVAFFSIDPESGKISYTGKELSLEKCTCIKFGSRIQTT